MKIVNISPIRSYKVNIKVDDHNTHQYIRSSGGSWSCLGEVGYYPVLEYKNLEKLFQDYINDEQDEKAF